MSTINNTNTASGSYANVNHAQSPEVTNIANGNVEFANTDINWSRIINGQKLHTATKNSVLRERIVNSIYNQGTVLGISPIERLVLLTIVNTFEPSSSRFGRVYLTQEYFTARTGLSEAELVQSLQILSSKDCLVNSKRAGEFYINYAKIMNDTAGIKQQQSDELKKQKLIKDMEALGVPNALINGISNSVFLEAEIEEITIEAPVVEEMSMERKIEEVPSMKETLEEAMSVEEMVTTDDFFADCA